MHLIRVLLFFFCIAVLTLPSYAHAQHIEQLFDEEATLNLSDSLYFLLETDYQLTISDVARRRNDVFNPPPWQSQLWFQRYRDVATHFRCKCIKSEKLGFFY